MKLKQGDLWILAKDAVICVTTNGVVRRDGACVMGRGTALQAKTRYPYLPYKIGQWIWMSGNVPGVFQCAGYIALVSFPVKHHWDELADLNLIEDSAATLRQIATRWKWKSVFLPRPGCGNGGLDWKDVGPLIGAILDDRFTVVTEGK